eukprot:scaffold62550_cov60-Phaeocystis_antarctica.AAC.10
MRVLQLEAGSLNDTVDKTDDCCCERCRVITGSKARPAGGATRGATEALRHLASDLKLRRKRNQASRLMIPVRGAYALAPRTGIMRRRGNKMTGYKVAVS